GPGAPRGVTGGRRRRSARRGATRPRRSAPSRRRWARAVSRSTHAGSWLCSGAGVARASPPREPDATEAPPGLHLVEELAADPVRGVPDLRLEEAELFVELELDDERVHLLVGQAGEHPDGLPVGDLDHVRWQLRNLLDDLHRARGLVVPDVHRVPLRLVEVARDRRVFLEELAVDEVAHVDREPRRAASGLAPEVDVLGAVHAVA